MQKKINLVFVFFSCFLYAQDMQNSNSSGYTGFNTVFVNPSFAESQFLKWDVTLASVNSFLETNYLYVKNASILGLTDSNNKTTFIKKDRSNVGNDYVINFDDTTERKNAFNNQEIQGPSFLLKLEKFNIGFGMRLRSNFSTANLPENLVGNNLYFPENYDVLRNISPFDISGAVWTEYTLHLSKKIKEETQRKVSIGANLKLLRGHEAFVFNGLDTTPITLNVNKLDLSLPNIRVRLSTGTTINDENVKEYDTDPRGTGFGVDFGMNWETKSGKFHDNAYDKRFGISILDLGFINYSSQAYDYVFILKNPSSLVFDDFKPLKTVTQFGSYVSNKIYGSPNTALQDTSFNIILPTVISLQYSKRFTDNILLDANIFQRIPLANNALKRINSISVTPRFEHKWWEAGLPINVLEYSKLRMGAFARIGFLTIGSDNILPIFFKQDQLTGYNVYFALRIFPFSFKNRDNDCIKCDYKKMNQN
jgi:hypothetical protein